jgi:hypothetical protein
MQVLANTVEWHANQVVVFQNCFMHHTWNNTAQDRILLYFDFWHPDLTNDERTALRAFENARKAYLNSNDGSPPLADGATTPASMTDGGSGPLNGSALSSLGALSQLGSGGGLGGGASGALNFAPRGEPPPPDLLFTKATDALLAKHWDRAVASLYDVCPPSSHSLAEFKTAGRKSELWHWLALKHGGDRAAMDRALRAKHDEAFDD